MVLWLSFGTLRSAHARRHACTHALTHTHTVTHIPPLFSWSLHPPFFSSCLSGPPFVWHTTTPHLTTPHHTTLALANLQSAPVLCLSLCLLHPILICTIHQIVLVLDRLLCLSRWYEALTIAHTRTLTLAHAKQCTNIHTYTSIRAYIHTYIHDYIQECQDGL